MKHEIRWRAQIASALLVCVAPTFAAQTIMMTVDGMVCAFCAQGIEKKLRAQKETADLFVSLDRKIVCVAPKEGADFSDQRLTQLLNDAGYTVKSIARVDQTLQDIRAEVKRK